MNIKVEQLAKKPFEVKASIKNLKKTYKFQHDMASMEDVTETKEGAEAIAAMTDMLDKLVAYISDTLHLTEKQVDTLEDLEQLEVIDIAQYVAMRIMGASDEDIEATKNEQEEGLVQESE